MFRVIHPNRWFFWATALLAIAGLAIIFFIQQANQEFEEQATLSLAPVTSWKTYRSPALGISVRYPPSWQIEIDPLEPSTVYFENPKNFNDNISLSVVEPAFEQVIRQGLEIASEEGVTVGGETGVWLEGKNARDHATRNVVLVRANGKLYYIAGSTKVFAKIISEIKFLRSPAK